MRPRSAAWGTTSSLVGSPGRISLPGSHGSEREGLPSLRSSHPVIQKLRVHAQCTNSVRHRWVTTCHHAMVVLNARSRLYFLRAHRTIGLMASARSARVCPVRRWIRQERTSALLAVMASLLIAGANEVNVRPVVLLRDLRGRKV